MSLYMPMIDVVSYNTHGQDVLIPVQPCRPSPMTFLHLNQMFKSLKSAYTFITRPISFYPPPPKSGVCFNLSRRFHQQNSRNEQVIPIYTRFDTEVIWPFPIYIDTLKSQWHSQ